MRKEYPGNKVTILNYREKLWTLVEGANEEAEIFILGCYGCFCGM
jgi:hypothetical protein